MVKIMENPIKIDDLGGTIIFGNTHVYIIIYIANLSDYPSIEDLSVKVRVEDVTAYVVVGWSFVYPCPTMQS